MIEYLLSPQLGTPVDDLDAILKTLTATRGAAPFDETAMAFVGAMSRAVLSTRAFRKYPELMAMAHWFRPANLKDLKADFLEGARKGAVFTRRGVVFHIAPSNVDSVFIYSWLLSLLCGNVNIARVSRRRSEQMIAFFSVMASLLEQEAFRKLALANLVLSYDHDFALTKKMSSHCHLRVVWGGDDTIEKIRAIPLPPLATELAFANRFSLAVIRADTVLALDEESLNTLARDFYNDAFWFNQQACSSPRTVIWIGEGDAGERARARFWPALDAQIANRLPENLPAQVMDRTTTLFRLAHAHPHARSLTPAGAHPSRILVEELEEKDRTCHDGNGLFIELDRTNLEALQCLLFPRDQTLVYFGFSTEEWLTILPMLPPHAADRIVPIGGALSFSPVWDGADLLGAFTRQVQLRGSSR